MYCNSLVIFETRASRKTPLFGKSFHWKFLLYRIHQFVELKFVKNPTKVVMNLFIQRFWLQRNHATQSRNLLVVTVVIKI